MKHSDLTLPPELQHVHGTGPVTQYRPRYKNLLPPCNHSCPAGENIQGWLSHVVNGDYEQAWRLLTETNPLPAIHGRVCYHPCEDGCNRAEVDEPVKIHATERFLGDMAIEHNWEAAVHPQPSGKRILVVGSGPAGLSAAYHLTRLGHGVEIYADKDLPPSCVLRILNEDDQEFAELARGYPIEKFSRTKIWQTSIDRGRMFGLPIPGYWMHVGDPETVKAAEEVLAKSETPSG